MTWDEAVAHALTLAGAELSTSYGQPAVKANCRAFLNVGHEPDTSFVVHLDHDVIEALMAAHPESLWKTPHYEGYPAVLLRYAAPDDLARDAIESAYERAMAMKPPRPRKAR